MKECDILGGQNILWPFYIFSGVQLGPGPATEWAGDNVEFQCVIITIFTVHENYA